MLSRRLSNFAILKVEEAPSMNEILGMIAFLAAYLILMKWVLPRFGVPT